MSSRNLNNNKYKQKLYNVKEKKKNCYIKFIKNFNLSLKININ